MRFSSRAVRHRLNSTSATAGITRKATSSWRRAIKLFLEPAEPGIGESVPRAIGCPARRIHFAMRLHNRIMVAHFPAALPEITDYFFAAIELRACRLIAIEIADQTNAERD